MQNDSYRQFIIEFSDVISVQLNSVCAFICNQVNDIAVDEVTPTKQARGDSGKEPKLHR